MSSEEKVRQLWRKSPRICGLTKYPTVQGFFPCCEGFLPCFEVGPTLLWKSARGQKNRPKPCYFKVLGENFFKPPKKCPKSLKISKKIAKFSKKSSKMSKNFQILQKFRLELQKTAQFRDFLHLSYSSKNC